MPPRIGNFVLTVGATGNQNGTALFEGVTVLFLAQVFGIDLSLAQQITVVIMSILAGVGTAGVPGGSLPLIVIVLQTVGIPPEGIGIILGVDRFLDMCRTVAQRGRRPRLRHLRRALGAGAAFPASTAKAVAADA